MKGKYKLFYTLSQFSLVCIMVLTPLLVYANDRDEYIPNVPGGVWIGWVHQNQTHVLVDEPELIKTTLDEGWNHLRHEWNETLMALLNQLDDQKRITIFSNLATVDRTELQVAAIRDGVSLKYIAHDNNLQMTLQTPWSFVDFSYLVHFDIAVTLTLQASPQGRHLAVVDAALSLQNSRIDSIGLPSDLALPLMKLVIEEIQHAVEQASSALLPIISDATAKLIPASATTGEIPVDAIYLDLDVLPNSGAILLCFKSSVDEHCEL